MLLSGVMKPKESIFPCLWYIISVIPSVFKLVTNELMIEACWFHCGVFSSGSLMAATAGRHCKQTSHLCRSGRADVSTTESLPPSCSYMKPQKHPSLSLLPLQREMLTPAERWQRDMCTTLCLNPHQKPSLAITNVLRSKQFSYVNLIDSNTMQ